MRRKVKQAIELNICDQRKQIEDNNYLDQFEIKMIEKRKERPNITNMYTKERPETKKVKKGE